MIQNFKETLLTEEQSLRQAARKQILGYLTAAFGLVAGLAWNEAIQAAIAHWIPLSKGGVAAKFVYAVIVTLVLVIAGHYLARLAKEEVRKDN